MKFATLTSTLACGCKETIDLLQENPILALGGIMYERNATGKFIGVKIGDGVHKWTELPYLKQDITELEAYVQDKELKEYQLRKMYEPVYLNEIIYDGGSCVNGL